MNVTLKSVKIHPDMSEETNCFSATIYLDNKRVGTVRNSGRGGCNDYHWEKPEAGRQIEEFAKTLPLPSEYFSEGLPMDIDLFIDDLMEKHEENKQYKRSCKTKTLFRLEGQEKGVYYEIKIPYSTQVKLKLQEKHGDKLVEIINERFVA